MNPADMIRLLDSIAQDRNIDRNLLLQDLEEAMKSAARKHFNSLDVDEFGCRVDPMTGEITMWRNVYEDIDDEIYKETNKEFVVEAQISPNKQLVTSVPIPQSPREQKQPRTRKAPKYLQDYVQ